jgi:uncharacterized membrane protein YfcA
MPRRRESSQRGSAANPQGGSFGERPIRAGEGSRRRRTARFGGAGLGRGLTLAAIGTLAGLFSGLFGVGGGTVIVPLLMLWRGYDERTATGTSLAAIAIIAAAATLVHGGYGNVHVDDGLLVGIPALGGVLAGTWLQQRVPLRAISLLFAALLVYSAIDMLAG